MNLRGHGGRYSNLGVGTVGCDYLFSDAEVFYTAQKKVFEEKKEKLEGIFDDHEEADKFFEEEIKRKRESDSQTPGDMVEERIWNLKTAEKCLDVLDCFDEIIEKYEEIIEDCKSDRYGVRVPVEAFIQMNEKPSEIYELKKELVLKHIDYFQTWEEYEGPGKEAIEELKIID